MALTKTPEVFTHFEDLTDPRTGNARRHNLLEMIVIALCAAICGAESWVDVERFGKSKQRWLLSFLRLENGVPSHDTFGRVFARLDTEEFFVCLQGWIGSLQLSLQGQGVAIDGKTLRRSFDRASSKSALHLVSAWAGELRISLGQVAVDEKSNEITAVPRLLELLDLRGAVVTLDAMHCQKETVAKIRERGADYVVSVKANQPALHGQLQQLFMTYGEDDYRAVRRHATTERKRGRVERREYYVAPAPKELVASGPWRHVRSVGMVYRHREQGEKESDEVAFFISSLPPKVRTLAKHVRGHWAIENSLHWVLDVTFSEDNSRIRKGNGQEIAAVFRRLALSLLQQDTTLKENVRGKRLRAGWENRVLEGILTTKSR